MENGSCKHGSHSRAQCPCRTRGVEKAETRLRQQPHLFLAAMSQQPGPDKGPQGQGYAHAQQRAEMEYICAGLCCPSSLCSCFSCNPDCGAKNEIKAREPIRCRECGHRIMYKKRTRRCELPGPNGEYWLTPAVVQFEAR